jgi:hypothetical protein
VKIYNPNEVVSGTITVSGPSTNAVRVVNGNGAFIRKTNGKVCP